MKIYVGCALTHAPEEFRKKVAELKERLKKIPSVEVLEFLGLKAGDSRDVFVHDIINCVNECDIMVAICDEPSTGLGIEMREQVGRGKPLLAFGHSNTRITRIILDPTWSSYRFYRYQDFNDIYETVRDAILVGGYRFLMLS